MKWVLVWWVIHPGHAQVVHMEKYQTMEVCQRQANDLLALGNVRAHCSHE
jgi:hypothetical protein